MVAARYHPLRSTKALQETISTLLGKRSTLEGEDLAGVLVADVPNGRNGKRALTISIKVYLKFSLKLAIKALLCLTPESYFERKRRGLVHATQSDGPQKQVSLFCLVLFGP
jgi:hypothetical protein